MAATASTDLEIEQPAPVAASSRLFHWLVLIIVFIGGTSSIAIEIAASRLLGPYFGTSTFIWANLIGLTLLYLSIGYYYGGRIADRWPNATLLLIFTSIAGFGTGLIPILSRPILEKSLTAFSNYSVGALYGSLVGVILLFAVPVTLLGFVSPYAIRLSLNRVNAAGNTAGSLYALSTVGSIIGSFLPVLVLIPSFGTYWTFYMIALALLVTSALGLVVLHARWAGLGAIVLIAVVLALAFFTGGMSIRPPEFGKLIHEEESEYNYIQVLKQGNATILALNDGHAVHSIYEPGREIYGGPWDYFTIGPYFNQNEKPADVKNVALIGLAAGTMAQQLTAAYGPIPIDGVEIDPNIVKVGREYFNMNEPNLNVIVQDGRYFLRTTNKQYSVIGIDAYQQPYIPFHLTTKEFFQEVDNHLAPGGVAIINAGRTDTDYRLVDVIASTMKTVFPNVYILDVDQYANSIVIGTKDPTNIANFAANINQLQPGLLKQIGQISLQSGNIREWTSTDPQWVFTDDKAPVERIIDQIIVDAARGE
ncbi:MAG TPA: fused MFS/spermidine synthase [Nitrolancea sp.]|nr:fused MFS/spermidine synthase [Nitrolancea sp.]